jgi:hypothetical protein
LVMSVGVRICLVSAISMICLLAFFPTAVTFANGRTTTILEVEQSPYKMEVRALPATPKVGDLHMAFVLWTANGNEMITNAVVTVTAIGPGPEFVKLGPQQAFRVPTPPNWYDLNIPLARPGDWRFLIDVVELAEGGLVTRFDFPIAVQSAEINVGIIVAMVSTIPALIAIAWFVRNRGQSPGRATRK